MSLRRGGESALLVPSSLPLSDVAGGIRPCVYCKFMNRILHNGCDGRHLIRDSLRTLNQFWQLVNGSFTNA